MLLSNLSVKLRHALLFVGMIALGFGAMRTGSKLLATALLYGVYFLLVTGTILGLSRGRNREAWVAFAAFGWAYFLPIFVFGSKEMISWTPTNLGLMACSSQLLAKPQSIPPFDITTSDWPMITYRSGFSTEPPVAYINEISKYNDKIRQSNSIGHCWLTLVFSSFAFLVFKQRNRKSNRT